MIDAENIHDIDDAKALMEEVISDIGAECPSGGIYEVKIAGGGKKRSADADEGWLELMCTKHGGDGNGVSSNPMVTVGKNVFDSMYSFVGEKKEEAIADLLKKYPNLSKDTIRNDNLRKYLLTEIYNGEWPEFDANILKEEREKADLHKDFEPLYIQANMNLSENKLSGAGNDNITVYASKYSGKVGNEPWRAYLIYNPKDRQWYRAPKDQDKWNLGTIMVNDRSWPEIEADMIQYKWVPIGTNQQKGIVCKK